MELETVVFAVVIAALTFAIFLLKGEVENLRGRALRSEILLRDLYLEAGYEEDEEVEEEKFNYGSLKGMFANGTEHRKD